MIKVAELGGTELDYWVARAEGIETIRCEPNKYPHALRYASNISKNYNPSTDWGQGGAIIERENISIQYRRGTRLPPCAHTDSTNHQEGETALIAAMRCYVASKFGAEIADTERK